MPETIKQYKLMLCLVLALILSQGVNLLSSYLRYRTITNNQSEIERKLDRLLERR